MFSRNGKYLLTSGKDSVARLWDLAGSGQPLLSYTGAELSGKQASLVYYVFICGTGLFALTNLTWTVRGLSGLGLLRLIFRVICANYKQISINHI